MRHTQGPWFLDMSKNGWIIKSSPPLENFSEASLEEREKNHKSRVVSDVCGFNWRGTRHEANARLMAAAPEMYNLLVQIKDEAVSHGVYGDAELISKIESLLQKIEYK